MRSNNNNNNNKFKRYIITKLQVIRKCTSSLKPDGHILFDVSFSDCLSGKYASIINPINFRLRSELFSVFQSYNAN